MKLEDALQEALDGLQEPLVQMGESFGRTEDEMRNARQSANELSQALSGQLSKALKDVVLDGEKASDVLAQMSRKMLMSSIEKVAQPLGDGLGKMMLGGLQGLVGGASTLQSTKSQRGGGLGGVNIQIQTPDIESFSRSKAQVASDALRALRAGQRNL